MSFITDIKEQMAYGMATINEYGLYFKNQAQELSKWAMTQLRSFKDEASALLSTIGQSIKQGFNFSHGKLKYFITHFPELAKQKIVQCWQWIEKGFQYGYDFIKALPAKLGAFAKNLYQWLKWGVEIGKWLGEKILFGLKDLIVGLAKSAWEFVLNIPNYLVKIYQYCKDELIYLRDLALELFDLGVQFARWAVKNIWKFTRFMGTLLKDFVLNIPHYLVKIYEFCRDAVIYLKDLALELADLAIQFARWAVKTSIKLIKKIPTLIRDIYRFGVEAFKFFGEYLQELGKALLELAREGFRQILTFCQTLIKGALKKVFLGLGMVYGISAAIIEFGMDATSSFFLKNFGLQLAQQPLFSMLGTGLSVGLTCFILYQLARVSVYALSTLLIPSLFQKQKAKVEEVAPAEGAAPQPEVAVELDERQNNMLLQYQSQNSQDVREAPVMPLDQEPAQDEGLRFRHAS